MSQKVRQVTSYHVYRIAENEDYLYPGLLTMNEAVKWVAGQSLQGISDELETRVMLVGGLLALFNIDWITTHADIHVSFLPNFSPGILPPCLFVVFHRHPVFTIVCSPVPLPWIEEKVGSWRVIDVTEVLSQSNFAHV